MIAEALKEDVQSEAKQVTHKDQAVQTDPDEGNHKLKCNHSRTQGFLT